MACFVVPVAEAVVVSVAYAVVKHHEKKKAKSSDCAAEAATEKQPFSKKLLSLIYLLLGGGVLLAFEHLWHGEIIPTFPFLSAIRDGTVSSMLYEMGTTGVAMAAICTLVWGALQLVKYLMSRKSGEKNAKTKAE